MVKQKQSTEAKQTQKTMKSDAFFCVLLSAFFQRLSKKSGIINPLSIYHIHWTVTLFLA
jgi:hypothetical protein